MATTASFELDSCLIPEEWELATISSFGEIISGNAFKSKQFVKAGVPVVKISNVQCGYYIKKNQEYLPESYMSDHKRFVINQGDLLIALTRPITNNELKICRYPFSELGLLNQRVAKIFTKGSVSENYIHLFFLSRDFKLQVQSKLTETLQPNLSPKDLARLYAALPPLAEQKVIADKLDSLLAQVETTKARLDRIPDILKRFRQSVLAAAVSGRLTEEWRENSELEYLSFESIQSEKQRLIKLKLIKKDLNAEKAKTTFSIPSDWLFLKLQSLAMKITDGEHKTPKRESSGRYLLSARNVRDGYISTDNVDYVGEEEFAKLRKRCDPNKGDVLISCSGSVGRISLVDEDDKYVMVRSAALVRVLSEFIENKFLMYLLQSPMVQKNIEESSKSTAQSNLFLGPIKELGIPLPSLEEQAEIVRRVEQLFTYADTIEQQVQAASARVNNLTQSILAKAFRGELTQDWRAANPDLISGDNSAAALLEKIKAERASMKPKKKARVKKAKT